MKKLAKYIIVVLFIGIVLSSGCTGGGTKETSSSKSSNSQSTTSASHGTSTTTQTTLTQTAAYWTSPWEYSPVKVGSEVYNVTYYKVHYKVQPNQSSPVYEYVVEKRVDKTKVHVYGRSLTGNTVDLGEHDVYQYETIVTPVKAANLNGKLTLKVWYKNSVGEAFVYPWDIVWASYFSPYGSMGANEFVGLEMEYGGKSFTMTNGAAFKNGVLPYFEGDTEWMSEINTDLTNLYMGWFAVIHVTVWNEFRAKNVFQPLSGSLSDGQGHTISWSSEPDGTAEFSGVKFALIKFQWSYSGAPEGTSIDGHGKFSPYVFMPFEVEGHFTYMDSKTGESTTIYGYMEIEDLKLNEVSP
ncbi:hypothetical protein [Thermococcus gorgonarius]|uniref:Lipoprotein n=1 Tax=Thermococcus gorgonarius TaxID=71997 RepID=A0A2Z2M8T8_THEGO|nr:hypothetical protein [Thermococcus gorgonarius]ASJ00832.1 hypothetical protein A3K92_04720 [Thermococcus gorgonarius]